MNTDGLRFHIKRTNMYALVKTQKLFDRTTNLILEKSDDLNLLEDKAKQYRKTAMKTPLSFEEIDYPEYRTAKIVCLLTEDSLGNEKGHDNSNWFVLKFIGGGV